MRTLKLWICHNWEVALALALAWTLAGWLGAQSEMGLRTPSRAVGYNQPETAQPPAAAPLPNAPANPFGAAVATPSAPPAPAEYTQGAPGTPSSQGQAEAAPSDELGSGGATVDPFSRPVEEEITEEVVARTDLSEHGSVIGQIFSSQEHIERMLGNDPTFIYESKGRRDPMIIPWIRREFDLRQLMDAAHQAETEGRFADAMNAYHRVVNEYAGTRSAGDAATAIQRLERQLSTRMSVAGTLQPEVILPHEVSANLTGILYDDMNPNCLIGDNIYGEGDKIPNYDVTILSIQEHAVTFLYRDQQFTVPVVTN
jgi:hypothetical protein